MALMAEMRKQNVCSKKKLNKTFLQYILNAFLAFSVRPTWLGQLG